MAHQVLEHINAYPKVLKSIDRLCRLGGVVYLNVPNPFSPHIVSVSADGKWAKPFIKQFIHRNARKFRSDFLTNTEKYHTGFTEATLKKYLPRFRITDKRKDRLKQVLKGRLFEYIIDLIPSCLLFLLVSTNIWVLEKERN